MLKDIVEQFQCLPLVAQLAVGGCHFLVQCQNRKTVILFLADGAGTLVVGDRHGVFVPGQAGVPQPVGGVGHANHIPLLFKPPERIVKGDGRLGILAVTVQFAAFPVILLRRVVLVLPCIGRLGCAEGLQRLNKLTCHGDHLPDGWYGWLGRTSRPLLSSGVGPAHKWLSSRRRVAGQESENLPPWP